MYGRSISSEPPIKKYLRARTLFTIRSSILAIENTGPNVIRVMAWKECGCNTKFATLLIKIELFIESLYTENLKLLVFMSLVADAIKSDLGRTI